MSNTPHIDRLSQAGETVSASEAARLIGVHPASITRWCLSGKLKHTRVGGKFVKVSLADLEDFLRERTEDAIEKHQQSASRAGERTRRTVERAEVEAELDKAGIR